MSSYDKFDKQIAEGTAENAIKETSRANFGSRGTFSNFYRYIVIDVVVDPQIVDDKKIAYWEHTLGVRNIKFARALPRNTLIAQRVLEGSSASSENPMFLFPFLDSALSLPICPGEHVWVMFENRSIKRADLGWWMSRIVAPGFVEDANHTHMPRVHDASFSPGTKDLHDGTANPVYEFRPGKVVSVDGARMTSYETTTIATSDEAVYEKLMTDSDGGKLRRYEPVPRYRKRPGDVVVEGRNNQSIVLGLHRTGALAEYDDSDERGRQPKLPDADLTGDGVGMIDMTVGRGQTSRTLGKLVETSLGHSEVAKSEREVIESEGDPDLLNDRSRILISGRQRVDVDFGLDTFNSTVSVSGGVVVEDSPDGDGAIVIKSDKIRIIARSDIEFLVTGFVRDDNGKMVSNTDPDTYAGIIVKAGGDIILRPSEEGYLLLGGADANKAIVCTDLPASAKEGIVTAPPLTTTMGGMFAGTNIKGQGTYSKKVLIK